MWTFETVLICRLLFLSCGAPYNWLGSGLQPPGRLRDELLREVIRQLQVHGESPYGEYGFLLRLHEFLCQE